MVRKKQDRPGRSRLLEVDGGSSENCDVKEEVVETNRFVEIDRSYWDSNNHRDIAEVIVTDSRFREDLSSSNLTEASFRDSKLSFRFRLRNVENFTERTRLGHWPVISANSIFLEVVETCTVEDSKKEVVVFSGFLDGPDEGVSGLVHLVSVEMMTVRPVKEARVLDDVLTVTMRVGILQNAFDACESLLENSRQPWRKSMINAMAWLRPEVRTQDTVYGIDRLEVQEVDTQMDTEDNLVISRKKSRFNAADFYEAIRPSKDAPMLEDELPDLLPELRPYQRRAAYWMVQREKGMSQLNQTNFFRPLCVPVTFLGTDSRMFYNPFSGSISLHLESSAPYVSGGILADEMGLGKTVELLACIYAHQQPMSAGTSVSETLKQVVDAQGNGQKRLKKERVECICGATTESPKYEGLWVQCDTCDAWQHADCVGYSPERESSNSQDVSKEKGRKHGKSKKHLKEKYASNVVEMDGCYICQLCSERIQSSQTPIHTGATLIVCPSPILQQWHAEINRHTRPGSVKTCVYEGVKNATAGMDISELVSADIVLTTYDVLKEDLSHDSDRNEGGQRLTRFGKRYPVIPTLLTRIFWWRVCLDEAQMVECNTAAATEMALRLHARHHWCITGTPIQRRLDDLYGLLRFISASPFEVRRWWLEVINDPYERRDAGAMEFAHKIFKQIMWRSLKVHVADELKLPAQEECVCWLYFSPIEAHFYQKQHETCLNYALEVIKSFKDAVNKKNIQGSLQYDASSDIILTHADAAKLLKSLLKLRQACCHPQVGSSGLRSLQHSPMTMEEVLKVLVGKSKIEGEEALRRSVVALNALAAIAIIERDLPKAVSLYREALTLAEEHYSDFQLDPLLNLHIHHNLAEVLADVEGSLGQVQLIEWKFPENVEERALKLSRFNDSDELSFKKQKTSMESCPYSASDGQLKHRGEVFTSDLPIVGLKGNESLGSDAPALLSLKARFRMAYENIKKKFFAAHISRLLQAQEEFRNSHMQVHNALVECKSTHATWWLEALNHIEKNKESSKQFISKIDDELYGMSDRSKRRFRTISGMKSEIQTALDSLENSRLAVIERVLEVDKTMEEPREEDVSRVRNCKRCKVNGKGPICVSCDLNNLFEIYEARLFFCHTEGKDGAKIVKTAEEAVDLQRKSSALNHFFKALPDPHDGSTYSVGGRGERKRDVRSRILINKSPSELEMLLGILKTSSKAWLGKDGLLAANKHLFLFEVMRKEFLPARSLAMAQAQILAVHDELKMATSRLRLKESDDDTTIDALGPEELITSSLQNTSEKFDSLSLLSRIKGQHRYLKGLILSKQKSNLESSSAHGGIEDSASASHAKAVGECGESDVESCPICHEKLVNQKMVFQCGHITCCKCLVAMIKQRSFPNKKDQNKWVICPTCREHTDFRDIAWADDREYKVCNSSIENTSHCHDKPDASVSVQGSYGTKIEAVTRRILWIKSTDPMAKVIVFSSWNDVLDVLEHALSANHISHIRMKGGRKSHVAISLFKENNEDVKGPGVRCEHQTARRSFQVMLLLVQHGANGLNLLEAKHVILVEPFLNPATEAQAINRVHRIGQDKATFVHRFIVKDTVEESIYKLNRGRTIKTDISGNTKNQDQPVLTLKDVESLFSSTIPAMPPEREDIPVEDLMHLAPAVAAALAAEKRWKDRLT